MRWEDERYVRLYTRDTPEWTLLSWEARSLMCLLLRTVDRAGIVNLGKSGLKGVASLLRMPLSAVEFAMPELIDDGCVWICDGILVVRNFIDAQEALQSDVARKRTERERARDKARATDLGLIQTRDESYDVSRHVTDCPPSGQDVTRGHAASHAVTPIRSVPSDPKEKNHETSPEPSGSASCELDYYASPTGPTPPADEPPNNPSPQEAGEATTSAPDDLGPVLAPENVALRPHGEAYAQRSLFDNPVPAAIPVPREPKIDPADSIFDRYITGWRRCIRGNRPPRLDAKRRAMVRSRLKDGWLVDELMRAVDGLWLSQWHIDNKQIAFELALRDAKHIEQFLLLSTPVTPPKLEPLKLPPIRPEIAKIMQEMDLASVPSDPCSELMKIAGSFAHGGII